MELWEGLTGITFILVGAGLLAYLIRQSRKEAKSPTQPKIYCVFCGAENSAEAAFCFKCGKKIASPQENISSDKSEANKDQKEDSENNAFFNDGNGPDLIFPEDGI